MTRGGLFVVLALSAGAALAQTSDIVVRKAPMTEETPVGPYDQPDWTTQRRFPTTRVYLQQQPWEVGFEQWVRSKYYDGDRGLHRVQEEVEIGLPHRFQLDIYENMEITDKGTWYHDNVAGELRYAFADWGKIPLNPTVYAEYKYKDNGADVAEGKLLLGDVFARGWNWGANFSYEWDLGGERSKEYGFAAALSHAVLDRRLSLGAELLYESASVKDDRSNPENSLNVGPSLQWRPTDKTHLDLVAMAGLTHDAPDILTFLVAGYDFGKVLPGGSHAPVSTRGE